MRRAGALGKHLLGRNLSASVKQPLLITMWKTDVVPFELSDSEGFHGAWRRKVEFLLANAAEDTRVQH